MANYYTHMTAEECVPCTLADFEKLQAIIDDEKLECSPDLRLEYSDAKMDPADHGVYMYAEECFDADTVPQEFWDHIGALLVKAGKPYLTCGVAFTCDRMRPQSHGGTDFRVYPDGQVVYADKTFDYIPAELKEKYEQLTKLKKDCWNEDPVHSREDWRVEAGLGHTNLGYWDWVWHQVEIENENTN